MSQGNPPGFTVTPVRLSFWLSVLAALTFGWTAVSYVTNLESKGAAVASEVSELKSNLKDVIAHNQASNERLSAEIKRLGDNIVGLSLSLKEVEVLQRSRTVGQLDQ